MNAENFVPRVGQINFLNVLPLTYGFYNGYSQGIELVEEVPAVLNEKLRNGELEISPVSSIAYARQSENLFLLPNICIRSDSDVTSIIFLSRKPVEEIRDDKIILTSKSATSHCLLKIILREAYGANPNYFVRNVSAENPVDEDATGALLIGDDALYNYLHTPKNFYCYDLGREWHKFSGHSIFFAVWAVQKSFANNFPELLKSTHKKILEGLNFGIKNKTAAINSVLEKKPFTFDELNKYLGGIIKWDMTADGLEGLKIFYRLAHKLNLLEKVPEIEFVEFSK